MKRVRLTLIFADYRRSEKAPTRLANSQGKKSDSFSFDYLHSERVRTVGIINVFEMFTMWFI